MNARVVFGQILTIATYSIIVAYLSFWLLRIIRRRSLLPKRTKTLAHFPALDAINDGTFSVDSEAILKSRNRIDRESKEGAVQLHIASMRLSFSLATHVGAMFLLVLAVTRHFKGVWTSADYEGETFNTDDSLWVLLIMLCGMIVERFPSCLTISLINVCHILLMSLLVAKTLAVESLFILVFRSQSMTTMRMGLGVVCGSFVWTGLLNLAYSGASILTYYRYQKDDNTIYDMYGDGHFRWFIANEIATTVVTLLICYGAESRTLEVSRAKVKEKISSQAVGTISVLLTALCDAVVRLSSDFHVLVGSEKLAALLLKQPTKLISFHDLMEEDDRTKFFDACQVCRDRDGSSIAPSLHVGMRDATDTIVKMQLFITRCPGDSFEYMLGVRELSREEEELNNAAIKTYSEGSATAADIAPTRSRASRLSSSSRGSAESSQSFEPVLVAGANGAISVYFDAMTWAVRQATPGFTAIGGPSTIGANLKSWLKNGKEFRVLVQKVINESMNDGQSPEPQVFEGLKFQPPVAQKAQIEYSADWEIELMPPEEEDDDDDFLVRATLFNVSQRRTKKPFLKNGLTKPKITSIGHQNVSL